MLLIATQSKNMKLSFSQWFKLRRNIAGITQAEIAKQLDIRSQSVSNWEKGVSQPALDPNQTLKLCNLLGVTLEEFVNGYLGEVELNE